MQNNTVLADGFTPTTEPGLSGTPEGVIARTNTENPEPNSDAPAAPKAWYINGFTMQNGRYSALTSFVRKISVDAPQRLRTAVSKLEESDKALAKELGLQFKGLAETYAAGDKYTNNNFLYAMRTLFDSALTWNACNATKQIEDALDRAQYLAGQGQDTAEDERINGNLSRARQAFREAAIHKLALIESGMTINLDWDRQTQKVCDYAAKRLTEAYAAQHKNEVEAPKHSNDVTSRLIGDEFGIAA
jgi:hypothetical protein